MSKARIKRIMKIIGEKYIYDNQIIHNTASTLMIKVKEKETDYPYVAKWADKRKDREIIDQFETLVSLEKHPHVLGLKELVDRRVIIMDYYEGEQLHDLVEDTPLQEELATNLLYECCSGLKHLHTNKIYHRDMSPYNIIITEDDSLKIVDFGNSARTRDFVTSAGTPGFSTPEHDRMCKYDERSDIYGLGAVLYYTLTGKFLHENIPNFDSMQPANKKKALRKLHTNLNVVDWSNISKRMQKIITKCLQYQQKDRYQSIDEILADMRRLGFNRPPDDQEVKKRPSDSYLEDEIRKNFKAIYSFYETTVYNTSASPGEILEVLEIQHNLKNYRRQYDLGSRIKEETRKVEDQIDERIELDRKEIEAFLASVHLNVEDENEDDYKKGTEGQTFVPRPDYDKAKHFENLLDAWVEGIVAQQKKEIDAGNNGAAISLTKKYYGFVGEDEVTSQVGTGEDQEKYQIILDEYGKKLKNGVKK